MKSLRYVVTGNQYRKNGQVSKRRYIMAAFRTQIEAQAFVDRMTSDAPGMCGKNHGIRAGGYYGR